MSSNADKEVNDCGESRCVSVSCKMPWMANVAALRQASRRLDLFSVYLSPVSIWACDGFVSAASLAECALRGSWSLHTSVLWIGRSKLVARKKMFAASWQSIYGRRQGDAAYCAPLSDWFGLTGRKKNGNEGAATSNKEVTQWKQARCGFIIVIINYPLRVNSVWRGNKLKLEFNPAQKCVFWILLRWENVCVCVSVNVCVCVNLLVWVFIMTIINPALGDKSNNFAKPHKTVATRLYCFGFVLIRHHLNLWSVLATTYRHLLPDWNLSINTTPLDMHISFLVVVAAVLAYSSSIRLIFVYAYDLYRRSHLRVKECTYITNVNVDCSRTFCI